MSSSGSPNFSPAARWTPTLVADGFTPVSVYFLHNYHRLKSRPVKGVGGGSPAGLNSTEAMLIIQIMSHKWSDKAPFVTVANLCERMGLGDRQVRKVMKRLDELGFMSRRRLYGPNSFYFDGLFAALEELYAEDSAKEQEAA